MTKRHHISLTTKLASALLSLRDNTGTLLIKWDHGKQMSAVQLISLYQFHHAVIPHEAEGSDEFWNLEPRLIVPHRRESAAQRTRSAHIRRVRRANDAHVNRLLAKDRGEPKPRSRWPSRPFPKRSKKLRRR